MLFGSLDQRDTWGRTDMCVYMTEARCCVPETITTLFIGYTPAQNKKFKKNVRESGALGESAALCSTPL